jgi:hypothetical protein
MDRIAQSTGNSITNQHKHSSSFCLPLDSKQASRHWKTAPVKCSFTTSSFEQSRALGSKRTSETFSYKICTKAHSRHAGRD